MEPVTQIKLHNKHIHLQKINSQDIVVHAIQHLTAQDLVGLFDHEQNHSSHTAGQTCICCVHADMCSAGDFLAGQD